MTRTIRTLLSALLVPGLIACSTTPLNSAELEVTSHDDGEVVLGSRAVDITGTVSHATSLVLYRGDDTFEGTIDDGTFTVSLELHDGTNQLELVAEGPGGDAAVSLSLVYPFMALADFASATRVIGGARDAADTSVSQTGIGGPFSSAAIDGGRLYLGDYNANRVLVYDGIPETDGAAASLVIGQQNFSDTAGGLSGSTFGEVAGMAAGDGRLFVADRTHNRILVWTTPPTANGAPASFALGQTALDTSVGGCAADALNKPSSVVLTEGRLVVGDTGNHRVLVWNQLPSSVADLPDLVLGQPNFETCDAESDHAFYGDLDVWSDRTRLLVSDYSAHRVLLWNSFPSENFAEPDVVLGQPDLQSTGPGTSADTLNSPLGVTSNGNQIFVTDEGNHRVLIWDSFPTSSGTEADRVIGQSSFTLGTYNDTDQDGEAGPGVSDQVFEYPYFGTVAGGHLFVADYSNGRYLVFGAP
jgi:hypothetical protein